MGELKEISAEDRFYHEVVELRKKLDLIIVDFESSRVEDSKRSPAKLIDHRTGKPFRKGRNGRG
jgi:hypothetical protein